MTDTVRGELGFDLAGYPFTLRWEGQAAAHVVQRLYGSCRVDGVGASADVYSISQYGAEIGLEADRAAGTGGGRLGARRGDTVIAEASTQAELAAVLDMEIANAALEHLTDAVAIHAGAVARGERALVLAGKGGSGKTTLALALSLAGLQPLCDDILLLDGARGQVRALPRSFLVKGDTARWVAGRIPAVADCALDGDLYSIPRELLGTPVDEATPAWIVFLTYTAGVSTELRPVGPLGAVERLLPLTCLPHHELFGVVESAKAAQSYELTYGSRDEAVAQLLRIAAD